MGKKLDCLLGRNFKASKFKTYVNGAISRIALLEKQHRVRCQQARSDVVLLLNLGHKDRALLRVEQVIREQNMLDAYVLIENYFNMLMERINVLDNNKECPEELKEAIASLIFAASRCGELPELEKIRRLFASRYGKELETRAVEIRNNCGVNPKIVKKLSTRRPSLDSKLKMLKEVAPTHDITKLFEGGSSSRKADPMKMDAKKPRRQAEGKPLDPKLKLKEKYVEKRNARTKYGDAESAAQAAYKFAAEAAEAARAAVQLARPRQNINDDHPNAAAILISSNQETNNESDNRYSMMELEKLLRGLSSGSSVSAHSFKNQEIMNSNPVQKVEGDHHQPPAAKKLSGVNSPSFGRKPHSVRTRRCHRMRSM